MTGGTALIIVQVRAARSRHRRHQRSGFFLRDRLRRFAGLEAAAFFFRGLLGGGEAMGSGGSGTGGGGSGRAGWGRIAGIVGTVP